MGANYYRPGAFFINGMVDLVTQASGSLDASIFLTSKIKKVTMSQSAKAAGNTKYVVKIPGEKRKSVGLHIGANTIDYSKMGEGSHSAIGLFGGLSILKARHTHWKIYNRYKQAQGTTISRFNADVIYYVRRDLQTRHSSDQSINDVARQVGFRVYFDGNATLWSRQGRLGLNYMLGVALNSQKNGIPLFAGFGLGYNFL